MKRRLPSLPPAAEAAQRENPEAPGGHRRTRPWTLWRLLPMLLLVCAALVISAGAEYDGTPTEPTQDENGVYQIGTAAELYGFAQLVNGGNTNANAVLTADITINENVLNEDGSLNDTNVNSFQKWTPIGNSEGNAYTGTFDGKGHTISGLYAEINGGNSDTYVGLFGYIGTGGTVQNVTVEDSSLSASTTGDSAYAGGVCGDNNGGTISNCTSSGNVTATSGRYAYAYAGGVCGRNYAHSGTATASISNCYSSGNVNANGYYFAYAGGVCGGNEGTASISNCYSSGNDVTASTTSNYGYAYAGGVCGYNYADAGSATIENCWSSGKINASGSSGTAYAGGVCGVNEVYSTGSGSATIQNCYWLDTAYSGKGVGSSGSSATSDKVEAKTADEFASGEVAYLLNQWKGSDGVNGKVWTKSTSAEPLGYPVLNGEDNNTVVKITVDNTAYYANAGETFSTVLTEPTKAGYTFQGWSTEENGGGTTYQAGRTIPANENVLTLYTIWTANTYTVEFHANGDDGSISNQAFTYDVPQALTANTFTRTGYTFAGWNTAADGSGTAYSDGQEISNLTAVNGGTVTLYAQWTANTYTVTVETSGNGTATASPASATMGTEITLTATPRSGCHFVRWDVVSGDITIQDNQFTMPAGDVTVKAVFARNAAAKTPSQQAIDKIERAEDGDVVTIDLPKGKTKLDKEVFETLAGRDVTLVLTLEGEVSWTIYGRDVPETGSFADTDMGVTMNTSTIPVDIINAITGEVSTMQLTLAHDGDFGFTLTLTAPLGAKYADLWANLYYYDGNAETLTFQTAAQIDRDGTASLRFTHASQYVIVIDDRDHTPKDFPFVDVNPGDWYYEAVDYVFQRDLMNGTGGAQFTPNGTASRAMVATILWRMAGEPQVNYAMSFADVPSGTWYTEAVRWAASEGIVTGYSDTKFGPDDPVTREQFAVMLYRYAQTLGEGFTGNWFFPLNFPDAADVSEYAYEALCWMTMENVIQGMEDGGLHPQGTANRAQLATMLMRFDQNLSR